mgnify:CR=1 FL=1
MLRDLGFVWEVDRATSRQLKGAVLEADDPMKQGNAYGSQVGMLFTGPILASSVGYVGMAPSQKQGGTEIATGAIHTTIRAGSEKSETSDHTDCSNETQSAQPSDLSDQKVPAVPKHSHGPDALSPFMGGTDDDGFTPSQTSTGDVSQDPTIVEVAEAKRQSECGEADLKSVTKRPKFSRPQPEE